MQKPESSKYVPPALTVLGTVAQLTQGERSGDALDASFPVLTPFNALTFS